MRRPAGLVPWAAALAVLAAVAWSSGEARLRLEPTEVVTGWALLAVLAVLVAYNLRKRLPGLPLGGSAAWLAAHGAGGLLAVALFGLHARLLWPEGPHERLLALLFYLVSLTGLAGWALQRIYPRRLTQTGVEVVYERIPLEIHRLRHRAEALVLECTREAGSDTVARLYLESLDWFFRRPRFFLSHALFGKGSDHWVRKTCGAVRRYLGTTERDYLDRLIALALHKGAVDFHHAAQQVMKGWLLVHVPASAATMALVLWHVLVMHAYRA